MNRYGLSDESYCVNECFYTGDKTMHHTALYPLSSQLGTHFTLVDTHQLQISLFFIVVARTINFYVRGKSSSYAIRLY